MVNEVMDAWSGVMAAAEAASFLLAIDASADIVGWTPSATAVLGYAADEVLGRSIVMLLQVAPSPERWARLEELILRVEARRSRSVFRHRDGSVVHADVVAFPVLADGGRVDRVDLLVTPIDDGADTSALPSVDSRIHALARACVLEPREVELLEMLASGHRVGTIARRIHLAPGTVRNLLSGLYVKLGVSGQGEVIELLLGERDLLGGVSGGA